MVIKRIIDLLFATIGLVVLSPIFVLITIVLYFSNQGSSFFFQTRIGKDNRPFKIIKFKTMNDKKDLNGNLLPDSARLTKVGVLVRKLSLDELPQLLNVLTDEMSLIGPRPLLTQYLPLYNDTQRRRHEVRPGITGWAQVNGRNAITWEQKFELDVWYVDHIGFWLDIKIMFLTIFKVLNREGINQKGNATMPFFEGNSK